MTKRPRAVPVMTPFTPSDYYRANTEKRIELLKSWAARVAQHGAVFSWDDLRKRFERDPNRMISCAHETTTLRVVLDCEAKLEVKERELATLRASMDDLCHEMDRIRESSPTFVMGPGTEGTKQ